MLSLLTIYLTLLNWPADHFLSRVFLVLLFFGFWLCFVFCLVFVCGFLLLLDCDGSLDYVSVLASSSF